MLARWVTVSEMKSKWKRRELLILKNNVYCNFICHYQPGDLFIQTLAKLGMKEKVKNGYGNKVLTKTK